MLTPNADFAIAGRKELDALLRRVITARDALDYGGAPPPPLVLKIAPDLTAEDLKDVARVALSRRVDGIIVSNTTLARPPPVAASPHGTEAGGLSGAPLFEPSTRVLSEVYALTHGRIPLIGTGGISSGHDAYRKIRAGASLVQVRTALIHASYLMHACVCGADSTASRTDRCIQHSHSMGHRWCDASKARTIMVVLWQQVLHSTSHALRTPVLTIAAELADCLAADGFACVADAVGADHKTIRKRK